jgi:hypothetical protein
MAYDHKNSKGRSYHLNSKDIKLKSTGRVQTIVQLNRTVKGDPSTLTEEERLIREYNEKFGKNREKTKKDGWTTIKELVLMGVMMIGVILLIYLWGLFVQSW